MAKKQTADGGRSTSNTQRSKSQRSSQAAPQKAPAKKSTTKKTSPPNKKKPTRRPAISKKRNERFQRIWEPTKAFVIKVTDPQFWRDIRDRMPPWIDELGAILLIVLGAVMLTALLNTTTEATITVSLERTLRQMFGTGAFLVSAGTLALGVILLLPKFGYHVDLGSARITGIELGFGACEALLHLFENDPEGRALARAGEGGGYLGWALSEIPLSLGFGNAISTLIYATLMLIALILITELRVHHAKATLAWSSMRIQDLIFQLDSWNFERKNGAALKVASPETLGEVRQEPEPAPSPVPWHRPSIVPRQADTFTLHESQIEQDPSPTPTAPLVSVETTPQPQTRPQLPPTPPARELSPAEREQIAQQTRERLGAENGRSLVSPGEPGERTSVVPRDLLPDAPLASTTNNARQTQSYNTEPDADRVFTINDFDESRKVGKRDEQLPPLGLLNDIELNKPTEDEINTNVRIIRNTLLDFDVEVEIVDVKVGPTVTQYAVSPYTESVTNEGQRVLNRVRVKEIANLSGDLALALSAKRLRIQAPVPGTSYVGVEVPNRVPSTVALRPVLESEAFYTNRNRPLALPLGCDVSGGAFVADLQTMPHLLVAGTTGSGKSIMLAAMTTAFVMNNHPDNLRLVLLDPKMVELTRFNGLPHLLGPVETELDRIIEVLRWATREMDRRYKLLEKEAARNIESYNSGLGRRRKDEQLPYIVIIIDEIGDLMMQRPDETERALTRLAQMARAVGMHLMVATQRPSVDVITGLIKANFPARHPIAVASAIDSRVILDASGADALMGRGDMLFLAPDAAGPQRIQGCYVSDEEVNEVVDYWIAWRNHKIEDGEIEPRAVGPWERGLTRREVLTETDPMLEDAIELVIQEGEASASLIQRRLGLGYPRAARIMDMLHELGIVGASKSGGRTREVLVKPGSDPFKSIVDKRMNNKQ